MRVQSRRPSSEDDQARGEFAENPEYSGTLADPDELLDEDAIERFGRDLEDDEIAARAAAENEDENEAGAPAVPVAPF
jgi:hypothetical protein